MVPRIFHLTGFQDGYVAIIGRPRGGDWLEDEIRGLQHFGIDVVVSLLEVHETDELELTEEERLCQQYGIEYLSYPLQDRSVPSSLDDIVTLIVSLYEKIRAGKHVTIM